MKVQFPLFISKCGSVRPLLWEYAGERLSEGPMETVERHLETCARCQREMESLRRAQNLLKAYRQQEPAPPRSDWSAVRERLLAEGGSPTPGRPALTSALRNRQNPFGETKRSLGPREWLPTLASVGVLAAALVIVTLSQGGRPVTAAHKDKQTLVADTPALPAAPLRTSVPGPQDMNAGLFSMATFAENSSAFAGSDQPTPRKERRQQQPVSIENVARKTQQKHPERLVAANRGEKRQDPEKVQFHPTRLKPEERPSNLASNTARPDDRFQTVGTSQHFIMGTLEPTQHDDDSTY